MMTKETKRARGAWAMATVIRVAGNKEVEGNKKGNFVDNKGGMLQRG